MGSRTASAGSGATSYAYLPARKVDYQAWTNHVWTKYEYDGQGNRYGYDEEDQLTSASYPAATPEGSPGPALRPDSFQYDGMGNRMGSNHLASRGVMTFARKDNGLNQYICFGCDPVGR